MKILREQRRQRGRTKNQKTGRARRQEWGAVRTQACTLGSNPTAWTWPHPSTSLFETELRSRVISDWPLSFYSMCPALPPCSLSYSLCWVDYAVWRFPQTLLNVRTLLLQGVFGPEMKAALWPSASQITTSLPHLSHGYCFSLLSLSLSFSLLMTCRVSMRSLFFIRKPLHI